MNRKLTHIILCLAAAALSLPAAAQHYIGLKGGYGIAQGRFYPKYETEFIWNMYNGGVMWKYYSEQQVVGGVSVELEYQTRGYRLFEGPPGDSTSYTSKTRIVNSITMPLIWQPHIYFANRKIRLFLNAGFTITYNLGIGDKLTVFRQTVSGSGDNITLIKTSETTDYKMITARDVRWNYGICGGLGVGFLFGRWEIFAEARYYYGMADILRNRSKYPFNEQGTIRSELDNLFVTVGCFFRLGKGGIKAPPLRLNDPDRKKSRQGDANDFRNIKLEF